MQARYYGPVIGRFLSNDPVGFAPNRPQYFNRYSYVGNDPINVYDPTGKAGQLVAGGATGCALTGPACPAGAVAGVVIAAAGTAVVVGGAILVNALFNNEENTPTPAPDGLVGEQDDKAGQRGNRHNSGPLTPENGGTGNAAEDFGTLTGGESAPAGEDSGLPEGSQVGSNGVILRPGTSTSGPRIDIPASGDKPHETLHYPDEENNG